MKKYFLLLTLLFTLYASSALAITGITFTTESQIISPATISGEITVSSGEKIGETADLFLTASSATGEFSSSASNWKPIPKVTWNTTWANRTFYYRDATAGAHTITATLTGRTSGGSWTATQSITVGDGAPVVDNNGNPNSTTTPPTTTRNTAGDGALSAHESPTPVGQVATPESFKAGAGRPRLASVHSPIVFQAESTGSKPESVRYRWSFGDGASAIGERVTHIYYFPGEYNVVINVIGKDDKTAVGRTTTTVIQPLITIGTITADRVEIINQSARELNLGGWHLAQGASTFTFPVDTIVATNKSIVVPTAYLGFSPMLNLPLTLTFPDTAVAFAAIFPSNKEDLQVMAETLRQLSAELSVIIATRLRVR